jgi:hypothetical protein
MIKAVADYGKALPEQILALGYAVLKGLTGSVNFTNPPIDLNVFKTALDAYSVLIGEAQDGGRKAITARNKQGEEVIRMLRALAAYVEFISKEDMNTFLSSGFQPRPGTRTPAQPLDQPIILSVDQGNSGQLLVSVQSVRKARNYELRLGTIGADGAMPASWSTRIVPNAKTAASFTGLTPGTTYAIQVRAYGVPGHTEWSDSAIRMVI